MDPANDSDDEEDYFDADKIAAAEEASDDEYEKEGAGAGRERSGSGSGSVRIGGSNVVATW